MIQNEELWVLRSERALSVKQRLTIRNQNSPECVPVAAGKAQELDNQLISSLGMKLDQECNYIIYMGCRQVH